MLGPRPLELRIVALIYTGGTVAHLLRLMVGFTWRDMPFWVDWALVVAGPIGLWGLLRHARAIVWRGRWERWVHWLIVAHLGASVLVHLWILAAGTHRPLAVFPAGYSYFALVYFALFAWRSWTLRLVPA